MKMSKKWGLSLLVLIAVMQILFVLNVWQSYRFDRLHQNIRKVQAQHVQVMEENKRLVVGIAGLRSPRRIRILAKELLNLEPVQHVQRIISAEHVHE